MARLRQDQLRNTYIDSEQSLDQARVGLKSARGAIRPNGAAIVGESERDDDMDSGPGPQVMAAETLKGDEVYNLAGDNIGQIEAIMLDVQSGRIAYAVLSFGGFLGMGQKLFAIPWHSLTLDTDRECFILDVDKARLEHAPGFDKDHWPSMADAKWAQDIHAYYGARPYWRA